MKRPNRLDADLLVSGYSGGQEKMDNIRKIKELFGDSINVMSSFAAEDANLSVVKESADIMINCLERGGKILVFGNGGSATDSQHMAAELVVRFEKERRALPCIALNADVANLTAAGNDYSFDRVFSRQVEALGTEGDVVMAISTSGNSPNVLEAVKTAKGMGLKTIALTGNDGGRLTGISDISIIVRTVNTARIQETHSVIIHVICKFIENAFV